MDTWETIDDERKRFADLTDQLTPEQWDKLSLCTAWKVRDVVAHVNQSARLTTGAAIGTALKYGFRIDTMLRKEAIKDGARPPDELRKEMRESIGSRSTPPGTKPEDLLADIVIHQQDIRRPLGVPATIPDDALRSALDYAAEKGNPLVPSKKRARTLSFRATDLDWKHGEGAEVSGPAEAILMALAGRPDALKDLSGPGLETLRARIDG